MKPNRLRKSGKPPSAAGSSDTPSELPFELSIGYQIRATHRALQRYLQMLIEPHGVTPGIWYFLRALWHENGLTQRELSDRTGTTEPTALIAIKYMETRGLVRRVRSTQDQRKLHVWLTPKGRNLKARLIPLARHVVGTASEALTKAEVAQLLQTLTRIQHSLNAAIERTEARA
jgi:MarR family transcriptional regulator, organic hydroperoxide resistance regulator